MSKKRRRRRRLVLVLAVLVAALIAARWWAAPWAVEYGIQSFLTERLRGRATLGDVDLDVLAGRVSIRDFEYHDPNHRPILRIAAIRLRFSLGDLIEGIVVPERVDLVRVRLQLEASTDGTNLEANLKPRPTTPGASAADDDLVAAFRDLTLPHVVLQDATVDVSAPTWLRREIRLKVEAELLPSALAAYGAQVKLDLRGDPDPERPESRLSPISLLGQFDARTTAFKLGTDSRGVRISNTTRELVTRTIAENSLDWLSPTGAVRVEVTGSLHQKDGFPDVRVSFFNAGGLAIKIRDFPYALEDVQGTSYLCAGSAGRRGKLVLDDQYGTHGRAAARLSGSIFGFLEPGNNPWVHLLVEGRDVPLDEDLEHALTEVEPELGKIWGAVSPQGTADFQCLLYKSPDDTRVQASIMATIRDGVFEYSGFELGNPGVRTAFPYRLEEVSGTLSLHLQHSCFEVTGRGSGGARITVRGVSRNHDECGDQPVLDVWIRGEDVPLDQALRRALKDLNGESLWRRLRPRGRADVRVHLTQRHSSSPIEYELAVLLGGKASFEHEIVPISLTDVKGTVRMRSGWRFPRFENVCGRAATGTFRLDGTLSELTDDRLELKVTGSFLGKALTRALLRSPLEPLRKTGRYFEEFEPVGNASTTVVLTGLKNVHSLVQLDFHDAYANGPALPFDLSSLTGSVGYDGTRLRFENIEGRYGLGCVKISGEQRLTAPGDYVDIRVDARNIDVGTASPPEVGPLTRLKPILMELRPLGVVAELDFHYDSREPERYPRVKVTAQDLNLRPLRSFVDERPLSSPLPAPIRIRSGCIHYDPTEGIRLKRLDAAVGATRFRDLDGVLPPARPGASSLLRMTTRLENLTFDSDLFTYLDSNLAAVLRGIHATGSLHSDALSIEAHIVAGGESEVRFTAPSTIRLDDFGARIGPELRDVDGAVRIEAGSTLGSGRTCRLRGELKGLSFRIFDMQVKNAEGSLIVGRAQETEDSPLFLRIDDLGGTFYEGRLGPDCNLDVLLAEPFPFRGYLNAEGVRVQQLLGDFSGSTSKDAGINGVLNTRFRFQADRAELGSLVAVGEALVTEGRFGSVPAFVTLFNYFNNHFHRLESSHIEVVDRKIYLGSTGHIPAGSPVLKSLPGERRAPWFRLSGDALDLVGDGYVNFGGEMEFQLEPRDIWLSTPIPGIRHVLDLLLRQTGTIYVLGTVERIDVQPILFGLGGPERGKKQPLRIGDRPLWPAKRW